MRDTIRDATARAIFLSAYADGVESGDIMGDRPGPGGDWADVAPDVGPRLVGCRGTADRIVRDVESRNGADIVTMFNAWVDAGGSDPERFGHAIGMSALGHGVSLSDDVPGYRDPDMGIFEYSCWDF